VLGGLCPLLAVGPCSVFQRPIMSWDAARLHQRQRTSRIPMFDAVSEHGELRPEIGPRY
jgi:hypothetical protein